MTRTRRSAGLVALTLIASAALIAAGCGGGGDGGTAPAQTGTVSGSIDYAATGDPLGGVEVSIGDITTTTGNDGRFTLDGVPVGEQVLEIEADPGRDLVVPPGVPLNVNIQGGQTTQLDAPIQMVDDVDAPPAPPA
ncbi:MAG: carboxypeptidase-like regulatory domain-containing protein [Armatimonadota bacterium]